MDTCRADPQHPLDQGEHPVVADPQHQVEQLDKSGEPVHPDLAGKSSRVPEVRRRDLGAEPNPASRGRGGGPGWSSSRHGPSTRSSAVVGAVTWTAGNRQPSLLLSSTHWSMLSGPSEEPELASRP